MESFRQSMLTATGLASFILIITPTMALAVDTDGDGIPDADFGVVCTGGATSGCDDNCLNTPNPDQADADANGIGNACEADTDLDGVPDVGFIGVICAGGATSDCEDNCPTIPNADQADADSDATGDVCEFDTDSDGIPDDAYAGVICTGGATSGCDDNCLNTPNPDQADADADAIGDVCDADGSFADGFFDDQDWSLAVFAYRDTVLDPTAGSSTAAQQQVGGNPAQFRETDITVSASGTPGNLVVSASFQNVAIHAPQVQGAISSVDFQIDARGVEFSHVMGFAVRQGGSVYLLLASSAFFFPNSNWDTYQAPGLTESDFGLCGDRFPPLCTGSGTPDFSSSGGPLEFGYFLATSSSETVAGGTQVDLDNWHVTIDAVAPVPAAGFTGSMVLVLLVVASGAGALVRGRVHLLR